MLKPEDLHVRTLGECSIETPLKKKGRRIFVDDSARVLFDVQLTPEKTPDTTVSYEKAGPRERIFFDPSRTSAAIVTCGGLSPGLNNVIRSAYYELAHNYGVNRVLGIREGYRGLNSEIGEPPLLLDHGSVEHIHNMGGTILGSSRGGQEPAVMVDFLEKQDVDILLCVGGDGTQRGANALCQEVERRGLVKSIVGIPKTIDNDIPHVWPSFGYATALETAAHVIHGAHVEAVGAPNGVTLVKLMGRNAGFIAAGAALVSQDANFVLVPEVEFPLDGENGLLACLERRLRERDHAVIVVAEGAGQHLFDAEPQRRDASGNLLHHDVGHFLRDRIGAHFDSHELEINLRYMDPSYLVRSVPANAWDRILADGMARASVHAAMAGKTDVMIGNRLNAVLHVPIPTVVREKAHMDVTHDIWTSVLAATGQPRW